MEELFLAQQGVGGSNALVGLFPFLLIVIIFYFILYRPNMQRQKKLRAMIEGLDKGDRIITNGGVYRTVVELRKDVVMLKISDQVKIKISRNAL